MDFNQIIAELPEDKKAIILKAMTDAETKGSTEAGAAITARIEAASPFLGKTEYPDSITNLALKVIKGETSVDALTAAVAAYDGMREGENSNNAQGENGEETPPETPAGEDEDLVSDEEGFENMIKNDKGGLE